MRPGPWEIVLILLVLVLLFGAKKLPDTARGLGRSLRIFKAEMREARDEDVTPAGPADPTEPQPPRPIEPTRVEERPATRSRERRTEDS